MHEGPHPDEEAAEFGEEVYHPDRFKLVVRRELARNVAGLLASGNGLVAAYQDRFRAEFPTLDELMRRIGNLVAIGAENGADSALDEVQRAFHTGSPLPYVVAVVPGPACDEDALAAIAAAIAGEFAGHPVYEHAYAHHGASFPDFTRFVAQIAGIVLAGTAAGAGRALAQALVALASGQSLPIATRRPRRLCLL